MLYLGGQSASGKLTLKGAALIPLSIDAAGQTDIRHMPIQAHSLHTIDGVEVKLLVPRALSLLRHELHPLAAAVGGIPAMCTTLQPPKHGGGASLRKPESALSDTLTPSEGAA